jgi:hypothetical protein
MAVLLRRVVKDYNLITRKKSKLIFKRAEINDSENSKLSWDAVKVQLARF